MPRNSHVFEEMHLDPRGRGCEWGGKGQGNGKGDDAILAMLTGTKRIFSRSLLIVLESLELLARE